MAKKTHKLLPIEEILKVIFEPVIKKDFENAMGSMIFTEDKEWQKKQTNKTSSTKTI